MTLYDRSTSLALKHCLDLLSVKTLQKPHSLAMRRWRAVPEMSVGEPL